MSNKTIGLYARPSNTGSKDWVIVEMRENGGETNLRDSDGEPTITNSNNHAIIRYPSGRKEMYDFATGHLRGI